MIQNKTTLEAVNHEVNENNRYVDDITQYKIEDRWEDITETNEGDCEDYGIAKIRKLLARGWPKRDLKLGIVGVTNPLGDHGVGCAREFLSPQALANGAEGQWWVLDNRFPYVMLPRDTGYMWIEWGIGIDWSEVHLT